MLSGKRRANNLCVRSLDYRNGELTLPHQPWYRYFDLVSDSTPCPFGAQDLILPRTDAATPGDWRTNRYPERRQTRSPFGPQLPQARVSLTLHSKTLSPG